MSNQVLSIKRCQEIQPYMGEVEIEKVWGREITKSVRGRAIDYAPWRLYLRSEIKDNSRFETIPAYSFLDMLGRVPENIHAITCWKNMSESGCECSVFGHNFTFTMDKEHGEYVVGYYCAKNITLLHDIGNISDKDPTEALAKLIIWLAENGHIKEVE